jgi:hypothetical protein
MKSKVFNIALIIFLLFVSNLSYSQNEKIEMIVGDEADFKIQGYNLIYGNSAFNIENVVFYQQYKIILTRTIEGANILLLDNSNSVIDTLLIKCAPANMMLYLDGDTFKYTSIFFYKSDLCPCCDYKPAIASFSVKNGRFIFEKCELVDNSHVKDKIFDKFSNFKVAYLEKEKKRKVAEIGYIINDKQSITYPYPSIKASIGNFFPCSESGKNLLLYNLITNELVSVTSSLETSALKMETSPLFEDMENAYDNYHLVINSVNNKAYLHCTRVLNIGKGRNKESKSEQKLYEIVGNKLIDKSAVLPKISSKLLFFDNRLFSIFRMSEGSQSKKFLYLREQPL